MTGWDRFSAADLRTLAGAIRVGRLVPQPGPLSLRSYVEPDRAEWLAMALGGMQASASTLAEFLELLAQERERVVAARGSIDLVWTGPEIEGMCNRETGVVVRELFSTAKRSVLAVGYAIHQGKEVLATLASSLDRNPELEVRMVVDIQRPYADTTVEHDLVARFAAEFRRDQWPGATLPAVFYDPRSLAQDSTQRSSMHAKCVVVDRSVVLVTSANFTAAAQQRNFELGLLVRDPAPAESVWAHFDALIRGGVLRSLAFAMHFTLLFSGLVLTSHLAAQQRSAPQLADELGANDAAALRHLAVVCSGGAVHGGESFPTVGTEPSGWQPLVP